jgi:hypothetical protein
MTGRRIGLATSIWARAYRGRRVLFCAVMAIAFGGVGLAHAGMGENDVTSGLRETTQANTLTFGCTLGNACLGGILYRLFSADLAGRVFRGGATIETNKTIKGIGFGSLVSTGPSADTLCWSGERTKNPGSKLSEGFRDCQNIFESTDETSRSCSTTVIRGESEKGDECTSVAQQTGSPEPFDYLIKLDPTRFGQANSVTVTRCSGRNIVTQCADATNLGNNVTVEAQNGMAAYDCIKYDGQCLTP